MQELIKEKLITNEDPYHLHKGLGIYCLLNYLFQLIHYFFYRTMVLNTYVILPHMLLHVSSFIFKVMPRRAVSDDGRIVSKMSMFIWEELRIHSLLFGFRSCLIILFPELAFTIVMGTMLLADLATRMFGIPNISTVRGNINVEKKSLVKKAYGMFFSTSQMGATLICLGVSQSSYLPNPILVFCTLPAIQTSAFGMTLLRKNLITKTTWQVVYSLELVLVYFFWFFEYGQLDIIYLSAWAYFLRVNLLNKYLLWSLFYLLHDYALEKHFEKFLEELFLVVTGLVFVQGA